MAEKYGLLIDYDWCTGCHSCEYACANHNQLPVGQSGILVTELGPWEITPGTWQLSYLPAPTDQCNLCPQRTAKGKLPTCVQHCQAQCMTYGTLDELYAQAKGLKKQALYLI